MGSEPFESVLPFATPLSPQRRPQRETLTLSDGYETTVYVHRRGSSSQRSPVLYAHGIQSHPGWFTGSGGYLADRGHAVFQVTRRGSGENTLSRGDAKSAGQLLDDVASTCRFILQQTKAKRVHLVGVSWGGKLLTGYAASPRREIDIASLTLVAPGIVPRVDVTGTTKLAIALSLLVSPRRRFAMPLNDVELFTDNQAMRDYLRRDRFRLHSATARFLYASRSLDRLLRRTPPGSLKIPTTLLLGRRDRIIDNPQTRTLVERLTAGDLQVREFDAAHTLEFQPDPDDFFEALGTALARGE